MSFQSFSFVFRRALTALPLLVLLAVAGWFNTTLAQESPSDPYEKPPVYVTARVFTARAKKGATPDLSDQIFRLKTEHLGDYEKWITGIGKAYPGFEIALLRTEVLRIYKSNKPGTVYLGPRNNRNLHFDIYAANSPGDGVTPGLDLIPMVEYHFGDEQTDKKFTPVTMAFPTPFGADEGMTYFFTNNQLSFKPESYVSFLRPGLPPKEFEQDDYFFIFVITTEPGNPATPGGDQPTARVLNDKQSAEWQANATRKVEPEWPATVKRPGFSGHITVRVRINPEGRVERTNIWNSVLPEAGQQAVAAARQWEFPATLFADSKLPVYALLTFTNTAPPATPEPVKPAPAVTTPSSTGAATATPKGAATTGKTTGKAPAKRPAARTKKK